MHNAKKFLNINWKIEMFQFNYLFFCSLFEILLWILSDATAKAFCFQSSFRDIIKKDNNNNFSYYENTIKKMTEIDSQEHFPLVGGNGSGGINKKSAKKNKNTIVENKIMSLGHDKIGCTWTCVIEKKPDETSGNSSHSDSTSTRSIPIASAALEVGGKAGFCVTLCCSVVFASVDIVALVIGSTQHIKHECHQFKHSSTFIRPGVYLRIAGWTNIALVPLALLFFMLGLYMYINLYM
ncbi:hypothetical protein RFI_31178 [Reticulomyxa filosa]|uniref:Uncharacterized protein n=1 Tax=Reticulomyxa filosa TaxID=46433 RepID=X6LXX3_RETFI|nr:hypothetical protein RFI_31178 [Reticulomyxa filosa]|eukprot:ETO06216.1 hypothetical protein RFI_31178 [Reticulomyxa filosa]